MGLNFSTITNFCSINKFHTLPITKSEIWQESKFLGSVACTNKCSEVSQVSSSDLSIDSGWNPEASFLVGKNLLKSLWKKMTVDIFYHPESNLFTCQIPELLVKPVIPIWDHSDFKIEPISQPRDELISRFVISRVLLDSLKDFINILFSIWTQSSEAAKLWGFFSWVF